MIARLSAGKICPRFVTPVRLVTVTGKENVNKVMKTLFCHPQSNGELEWMHDNLFFKKGSNNDGSWNLYIKQMLAAISFNVSVSTKFSPYYLLYNRDVVLSLDNILKPRCLYSGDEYQNIALKGQHRTFTLFRNNLKRARKRQIERSNISTNGVDFKVGNLVYYKKHSKRGKLDMRWRSYYVVVEKTCPVSYKIKDRLTSSVVKG